MTAAGPTPVYPGEPKPGEVLDGRFELGAVVARGGMAAIFKARDLSNGATVAVKIPHLKCESDPALFMRFRREADILRRLDHPYILKIVEPDRPRSRPYLAMEYLEGTTLHALMAANRPMSEKSSAAIAGQLCDALEYLRLNRIVHCDLKPDNIMICEDGTIRLFDFGIAWILRFGRKPDLGPGQTLGTPAYMSPEAVKGRGGDHRADIFSLGAILYEMVTGEVPYDGNDAFVIMNARLAGDPAPPRQVNPNVSAAMEEVILHALARDPDERYSRPALMRHELEHLDQVPLTGRAERLDPIRIRFWHSNPWILRGLALTAAAIAVQFAVFAAGCWLFTGRAGR